MSFLIAIVLYFLFWLGSILFDLKEQYQIFFNFIFLLGFGILQLKKRHKNNPDLFLLQMPTLVVLLFLFLQIILPLGYILLFFEDNGAAYFDFTIGEDNYLMHLNKTVSYTNLGMLMFWLGVNFIDKKSTFSNSINSVFSFNTKLISNKILLVLYCIGIISRLIQINLDVYGYGLDMEKREANLTYIIPLQLAEQLCTLALFFVALQFSSKSKYIYYIFIFSELFFGIVSGMKFNVIIVGLILLLTEYYKNQKISWKNLTLTLVLTLLAYTIIEPLRMVRRSGNSEQGITGFIGGIGDAVELSQEISNASSQEKSLLINTIIERFEITSNSTKAIIYKNRYGLSKDDPEFFKHLTFAPFYAVVPRFLWKDKPTLNYGRWFYKTVVWNDNPAILSETSAAIGVIGYLYLAGGIPYILLHMFIMGMLASFFTRTLLVKNNIFKLLLYLSTLQMIIFFDVLGIYNHIFKTLPIMILIFKFMSGAFDKGTFPVIYKS